MPLRQDDPRAWYSPATMEDGGSTACELPTDPTKIGTLTLPSKSYYWLFVPGAAPESYVVFYFWPPGEKPDAGKLSPPKAAEFRPDPFEPWVEGFNPNDSKVKAVGIVMPCGYGPFRVLCPDQGYTLGIRLYGSAKEPLCYLTRIFSE